MYAIKTRSELVENAKLPNLDVKGIVTGTNQRENSKSGVEGIVTDES